MGRKESGVAVSAPPTELPSPFVTAKVVGANFDPAVYHKQTARRGDKEFVMSRGELMDFLECPHRWRVGEVEEDEDEKESPSLVFGNCLDCLIITPEQFVKKFVETPLTYRNDKGEIKDWSGNANVCKAWKAEQKEAGRTVVNTKLKKDALDARTALLNDAKIKELIDCSERQVYCTAEYVDKATGLTIPIKTLIDLKPDVKHPEFGRRLADYKTAKSVNPRRWKRSVFDYHYHTQAALYLDVYNKATGENRIDWAWAIQENKRPFEPGRELATDEYVQIGRANYRLALKLYARCLAEDRWPGYDDSTNGINGWTLCAPEPWMILGTVDQMAVFHEPEPEEEKEERVEIKV
jgi:hypothetical protein